MKIIDTHAHYNDDQIYSDLDNAIIRAKQVGVEAIFNNGDSLESFDRIISLQDNNPELFHSVLGIHPEFANRDDDYFNQAYSYIRENINKISAIGEIGLDYHYSKDAGLIYSQKRRFIEQIDLAKELNLPIVIHSRDADFDTLNIIKETLPPKIDLHCFSGSVEIMKEYLKLPISFHIGIGGVCTFKNAKVIKDVVKQAPLSILLSETDSPYLAPTPHRGERNESCYLPLIIEEIAKIKEMNIDDVSNALYKQGKEFYGI